MSEVTTEEPVSEETPAVLDPDTCAECGFALASETHIRGIGLHGHTRTTRRVADEQRADVMRRAHEFAERMAQADKTDALEGATEAELKAALAAKAKGK